MSDKGRDEYLYADEYKDRSAEYLGLTCEGGTESLAEKYTRKADDEGHGGDQRNAHKRLGNIVIGYGEADGERVD